MNEEASMEGKDFLRVIRKNRVLIIIVTLVATILTAVINYYVVSPTYKSNVSIIVGKPQINGNEQNKYDDVMMYQNLIKTYSEIAKSSLVSETTAAKLDSKLSPQEIRNIVSVTPQQGTQILLISAKSKSPKQAYEVIDKFSKSFIEEANNVFPTGGDIQIMDSPQMPKVPVKPKKKLNTAIAFALGLMSSIGMAFLLDYMDNTIKTEQDIERYIKIPVLGMIPKSN